MTQYQEEDEEMAEPWTKQAGLMLYKLYIWVTGTWSSKNITYIGDTQNFL